MLLFDDALIVLGAAGIVIPLFHRLRVSPILGFVLVGIFVGPFGLGQLVDDWPALIWFTISERAVIDHLAELGVVFLMFMIGLELSWERLTTTRRLVFGLGALQVAASTLVIAAAAWALGLDRSAAITMGVALAMSSTAVVIQVLIDEKRLNSQVGRACFAILLFQDLAVVPALFMIGLLGGGEGSGLADFLQALIQAGLAVGAILGMGRLALRPLFRSVARTKSPELFMAMCLLVVLATGLTTAAAGLSMALGALIAGLLLAETEYRRQVEITIEPFKGLFLGVFLMSIGMSLDLPRALADPLGVLALALALVLAKLGLIAVLVRAFGQSWSTGLQAGLLLGPGGEFGFVILGVARENGLMPHGVIETALLVAALTLAAIPFLSKAGRAWAPRLEPRAGIHPATQVPVPDAQGPRVVIAGFGRVGQTVGALLSDHGIAHVALDSDPDRVAAARAAGQPVYFGDMARPDLILHLGLDHAQALVVTIDDAAAAERLIRAARSQWPDLVIVARARDARHAARLYRMGVTDAVPETIEASLQLSEAVLVDIGVPMGPVIASIHERRAAFQGQIKAMAPDVEIPARPRRRVRDARRV